MSEEGFTLLPCGTGVCPQCAKDHPLDQPHNAMSLYYQYHFYARRGRWPTWKDALEHCSPEIRRLWGETLKKEGHWSEPKSDVPDVLPTVHRTIDSVSVYKRCGRKRKISK